MKIFTIILLIGIITQASAFDARTIEMVRNCSPLLLFPLAPFILGAAVVIAVGIIKHTLILIFSLFKVEE